MSRLYLAATGLALSVLGMAVTPAAALEVGCLWDNLPAGKRTELMSNYRTAGADSLDRPPLTGGDMSGWIANCGVTDANIEMAQRLLGRAVILHTTPDLLASEFGVSADALERAWKGIDPDALKAARQEGVRMAQGDEVDPIASQRVLMQMVETLEIPDSGMEMLFFYVGSRLSGDFVAP